jgi:glyoxylase-like metal-dependent hydrolase (beta-lactamase superfamily II)
MRHFRIGLSEYASKNTPSVVPIKLGIVKSFIVKGEKTIIVDTGYPGNGNKILHYLHKNSIKSEDVSLIILTHAHIDHYGSAEELRRKTGAPIAVHEADAEYVKKGLNFVGIPTGPSGKIIKSLFIRIDKPISKSLDVDIVFNNDLDLNEFGIDGKVIHTPGHTEGSVSLVLSGGEIIVGDLITGGILFNRIPHYPLFVWDMYRLKESIMKVIQLSPKIIYASHGGPFSFVNVQKFSLFRV